MFLNFSYCEVKRSCYKQSTYKQACNCRLCFHVKVENVRVKNVETDADGQKNQRSADADVRFTADRV